MEFSPVQLEHCLSAWPAPRRYVVLASGGGDSTVLLHAMAEIAGRLPAPVVVLHFDHGLAENSGAWEKAVREQVAALGIECFTEALHLDADGGAVETRARTARYARLRTWMSPEDCCLTAHHADDQAETFLLQALRGTGPAGLAAMPVLARFGPGWLGRPLLDFTRSELRAWAESRGLAWIEDPGNASLSAPRNRLRHRVWPEIAAAWPAVARTLGRSAALAAEAAALIEEVATEDLDRLGGKDTDHLPVVALVELSVPRRRALLRHWLRRRGFQVPEAAKLLEAEREFILRDPGARATLRVGEDEIRRFRGQLYALQPLPTPPTEAIALVPGEYVNLGRLGQAGLIADPAGPLASIAGTGELRLRFRIGGETIRPAGSAHHRALKKLLQERSILPWMRFRMPLLYVNGALAAVAGVTHAEEFAGKGWRFDWHGAPVIQ
ncbi:MAG: tRNA lysidine(34) synthetase TilS [Gammaproteobacteria bacterium]